MHKTSKILIVTTVPETIKVFMRPFLKLLKEVGFDVHIATGYGCDLGFLKDMNIVEHRLPLNRSINPFKDILALFKLLQICRKEKFDLIHTHTLKASLVGQIAAKISGIKRRIITAHGTVYSNSLPFVTRKLILISEKVSTRFSTKLWVLNSEDYDFYKNMIKVNPNKIEILSKGGIGVDLEVYKPNLLDDFQIKDYKEKIGIPIQNVVISFVGRLVRDKGCYELIQAWEKIESKFTDATLLIITPKMVSERENELVCRHNFSHLKNIVILENRNDMPQLYNCMDILVLPSYREGFSRVIIEAMASGILVIASDVKGCRDAILDGETGILIKPRDVNDLFNKLSEALLFRDNMYKIGDAARDYSLQNFDHHKINQHILRTYNEILGN